MRRVRAAAPLAIAFSVIAMVALALINPVTTPPAAATAKFDPGMIISDEVFYDSQTMTVAQIQTFLNQRGSRCNSTNTSAECLKDYTETTGSRSATSRCAAYRGASNQTAAQIIADVARICDINPQVLLVTLQKEQGLVTTTSPTARKYQIAMGYGCPDTAPCDTEYYGFFNQMYNAASQFQRYRQNPSRYAYVAGRTNFISYHPRSSCGSSPVYIENQATAGLYNYTPYQPNSAALAAGYGTGNSCSSYGNRNFFNYFNDWFDSLTTNATPLGVLDSVSSKGDTITVRGWALDPDTSNSIRVHVYVDGKGAASIAADQNRPDLVGPYGLGPNHGFSTEIKSTSGTHRVCAYAIDSAGGTNKSLGCKSVQTSVNKPLIALDSVTSDGADVRVRGWAMSRETRDPIRVHVYADGRPVASVAANRSRPDVDSHLGNGANHGYDTTIRLTPGSHRVCAYAIDPFGGPATASCKNVGVSAQRPLGIIDSATSTAGAIEISGWAMSWHTTSPVSVRATIDGAVVATERASDSRPDVGRAYGNGSQHGYSLSLAATPGSHRVCMEVVDDYDQTRSLGCRNVTVRTSVPVGIIDEVRTGDGTITLRGWAMSKQTPNPIRIHTYVDGRGANSSAADQSRPDVDRAYGNGANHGFQVTVSASPGSHRVCMYAINPFAGSNKTLGCRSVDVP